MMTHICFFTVTVTSASELDDTLVSDASIGGSSYFLDRSSLIMGRTLCNSTTSSEEVIYEEKGNPSVEWVLIPLKSSGWYHKVIANVVAARLHKKLDKHSLVPQAKFVIEKEYNGFYKLHGSVYSKNGINSAVPISKMRGCHSCSDVYKNNNVERSMVIWNSLGLSISPDPGVLGLSEDNKLIRRDYYTSFQYKNPRIFAKKKCFYTSRFLISDYKCDVEYIKTFQQKLQPKYREMLEETISEINVEIKSYLKGKELAVVENVLEHIMDFESNSI